MFQRLRGIVSKTPPGSSRLYPGTPARQEISMIILGLILLIIGVVLALLGASGRAVGGRRHYW
jgi:hypothetical protein